MKIQINAIKNSIFFNVDKLVCNKLWYLKTNIKLFDDSFIVILSTLYFDLVFFFYF